MTRILHKILAVLGIGSITLFSVSGCDYLAQQFARGFEIGYNGGDFGDLVDSDCSFDDIWEVDSWDCDYSCEL